MPHEPQQHLYFYISCTTNSHHNPYALCLLLYPLQLTGVVPGTGHFHVLGMWPMGEQHANNSCTANSHHCLSHSAFAVPLQLTEWCQAPATSTSTWMCPRASSRRRVRPFPLTRCTSTLARDRQQQTWSSAWWVLQHCVVADVVSSIKHNMGWYRPTRHVFEVCVVA